MSDWKEGRSDALRITRLQEVLDYENPWLKVYFDRVKFPNGKEGRYLRLTSGEGGVVILPMSEDQRVGLVHIYRYPISSWQWELPRGFGEPGLSPLENAKKELSEELGVSTKSWDLLGKVHPNSGTTSGEVSIFLASNVPTTDVVADRNESIDSVGFFTSDQLTRMIADGDLQDGFSLSAFSLAMTQKVGPWSRAGGAD
jgi:ADP-ribose pyrophosphatase